MIRQTKKSRTYSKKETFVKAQDQRQTKSMLITSGDLSIFHLIIKFSTEIRKGQKKLSNLTALDYFS